ncbi:flagellar basal-body rod protein FlgG [Oxalobacteraceae bacterium GrIS 2.11]
MIPALWTAKTGLDAQQTKIDVIANNLANVSTTAFKSTRPIFEDLMYQTVRQPGAQSTQQTQIPSGLQIGLGVRAIATERIFTQGNPQLTSNSKDVAIDGPGFFQVLMPDGSTAYTRDGSFQMDSQGQLVTANGYPIQPAITIPATATSLTIGRDGVITVTQPGSQLPVQIGAMQLATFVNPAGLDAIGENMYLETGSSGNANTTVPGLNGSGTLMQSYVESSNVNVANELVSMIETQRAYEMNSQAITAADRMLQRLVTMAGG